MEQDEVAFLREMKSLKQQLTVAENGLDLDVVDRIRFEIEALTREHLNFKHGCLEAMSK